MKDVKRQRRINAEKKRIMEQFAGIDTKKKELCIGLVERAAHMRVQLEDWEQDLEENGYTESFQQGTQQKPYDRKRPIAELYISLNRQYKDTIAQLTTLLPKGDEPKLEDAFDSFVNEREDL